MDAAEVADRTARVAAVFDLVSDTYDTGEVPWFGPIAEATVAHAAPRAGDRALDLGTGRGAALWPLVAAVGPGGTVTGLDISPAMIAATRADADRRGLTDVRLVVGDAAAPEPALGGVDCAVASLVLFFLPDPAAGLRAWYDLLTPGGQLAISTFGGRDAAWADLDDVFTSFLPPGLLDARTSGQRGHFATDDTLADLFSRTGFTQVQTRHLELAVRFADLAQWRAWSWSHGQRTHWLAVPPEHRDAVLADAAVRVAGVQEADGSFLLHQTVRLTRGTRPVSP